MSACWRLDDGRQTLVLGSDRGRLAEVVYWGPSLPESEDLATLYEAYTLDVTGGMLDVNPELSICPEATRSFPGQPGLIIRNGDGTPFLPKFCLERADVGENVL
ncbi:MAG: alpha-galactosidase, partial [Pseudomonadota bacterium]